jgi:4-amino-4-deoxy-L-arabinose transferase-like glycosyltransferase
MIIKNYPVNYKLLLLILCLALVILTLSYYDPNGNITPDSANYLRLAKNLLSNRGFMVPSFYAPEGKSFFANWPVGYPVLIFIVSKFSGAGIFLASRLLNILVVVLILFVFKKIFKGNEHWAGLIFFTDTNISLLSSTWSEIPFIFFLLCTGILLYKCVMNEEKLKWFILLFLSGTALFMMRYFGLIVIGIIGFVALTSLLKHRWHLSVKLIIVASLQLIFAGLYMYHNKITAGTFTGVARFAEPEPVFDLLKQFTIAITGELSFIKRGPPLVLTACMFLLAGFYVFSTGKKNFKDEKPDNLWVYLFLSGLIYYAGMIFARWLSRFDPLGPRLLGPGTFLLILSLFSYLQGKQKLKFMSSNILYIAILLTLTINYLPAKLDTIKYISTRNPDFKIHGYSENLRGITERYKDVEPHSVVLNGPDQLFYLYDDIIPAEFAFRKSLDDNLNYFADKKDWNIYVDLSNNIDPGKIDESFIPIIENNKGKEVVRIR